MVGGETLKIKLKMGILGRISPIYTQRISLYIIRTIRASSGEFIQVMNQ